MSKKDERAALRVALSQYLIDHTRDYHDGYSWPEDEAGALAGLVAKVEGRRGVLRWTAALFPLGAK